MKRFVVGLTVLMLVFLSACEIDGAKPCLEEKGAAAILSTFPDSIEVGDTPIVSIRFVLENSCGKFDRFDITNNDQTFDVKLITKYVGCNCNLEFTEEQVDFVVDIDFPGVYKFNFWQADGDYDTRTIHVLE